MYGPSEKSLAENLKEARDKGCSAVLVRQLTGKRAKDKDYDFILTYEEVWYDAQSGAARSAFSMTMNTEKMTPILSLLAMAARPKLNRARERRQFARFVFSSVVNVIFMRRFFLCA